MKPLQGETAWLITDGKAGHEAQAQGVAEALGVAYQWRRVTLTGLARMLAPWGLRPPTLPGIAHHPGPILPSGLAAQ